MDKLPKHERITLRSIPNLYRYIRPHRFWNPYYSQICQLASRAFLGNSNGKIWLSTYYTEPIAWSGSQVLVAYDFIYEKYSALYWQNKRSEAEDTIRNKAKAISKANLVICISETTRKDLMELYHVPINMTTVVYLAHKPIFKILMILKTRKRVNLSCMWAGGISIRISIFFYVLMQFGQGGLRLAWYVPVEANGRILKNKPYPGMDWIVG